MLRNSVLFRLYCQKCLTHPFLNGHQGREGPEREPPGWLTAQGSFRRRGVPERPVGGHGGVSHAPSLRLMIETSVLKGPCGTDKGCLRRCQPPLVYPGPGSLISWQGSEGTWLSAPGRMSLFRALSAPCSCPGCLWRRPGVVSQDWL